MIEPKTVLDLNHEVPSQVVPSSFHLSAHSVHGKLLKWLRRFYQPDDSTLFNQFLLFYLLSTKRFLDHRSISHVFRLILSVHFIEKKLLHSATFSPHLRHLQVRWLPTSLLFPFSSKRVLGCLIGFNVMDRYELFDEENVLLSLQKQLPSIRLVKDSSYCHASPHKNLKIFYFEVEKNNGMAFTLEERNLLKDNLEEKARNSVQTLLPSIFMGQHGEDVYKNILVLSQEIHALHDLPQAHILLDQQTSKEITFRVTLVFISPFHRFSLKECFFDCSFISQRSLVVRHLENHPIEAHIFRLSIQLDKSLLRSDGSLDFYVARKRVVELIKAAIGEFRDYNGGIIIKQQELLQEFKEQFPELAQNDSELMETFFYGLNPMEKQVVLKSSILFELFNFYLKHRKEKLTLPYSLNVCHHQDSLFLIVHGINSSLNEAIYSILHDQNGSLDIVYNTIETTNGFFFNCVLLEPKESKIFIQSIQDALDKWHQKLKKQQSLKIAVEYSMVSLDPRIGGEFNSGNILKLLFEGLTRYDQNGTIENGIAENIEVSSNLKQYTFKLRPSHWNDGTRLTAFDFEYAWKKILSPDFKTSFAYHFYPIKNAREAKEGKVSSNEIGIEVIDERTLRVELVRPTPFFLQLTADPLFSPVNRLVDQQHPQWPYQSEKNYPCNGPFQLKINQPNQGYQFIKNPYYWDAHHILLDQITLTQMTPNQASIAIHKKEIDWAGNPFGSWHSFYTPQKEERIVSLPDGLVCWHVFNTTCPLFSNQKFRQAFSYAIERSELVKHSAEMPLSPAYSILIPHYRDKRDCIFPECNPSHARQLLQEALEELNLTKEALPPLTLIFNEKGIREYTATILSKQFKEHLGIRVDLQPLPWNLLFNRMTKGNFQMGLMHWLSRVDDPIYTFNAFRFASEDINFAKWESSGFQHLLELGEQEINPFLRSSYLLKAEEFLSRESPVIPLFYQPHQALVRKDLHIVYKHPCGPFNIARCFYKKEN